MARPFVPRSEADKTPLPVAAWLILCACFNCAGWLLSAAHRLNATGYLCVIAAAAIALLFLKKGGAFSGFQLPRLPARRFKGGLPLAFAVLAALVFTGGALYFPSNYDGLAYRTPRVLHWLAEGRWHWIPSDFARLNTRAPGFEWMCAPLIALTKTDRLFFLINFVPFLLMPGLVFGVLAQLGVRRKVAWRWMWIVPTGYCFLLQAGSIANDLPGAFFALAAVDFALRSRRDGISNLWLSILAAALMTGTKASNLPLLLPWFVAALPSLKLLLRAPLRTALTGGVAVLISVVPSAALNVKYCGDWSGLAAEGASMHGGNHALYFGWNTLLLPVQNLAPPVFPLAGAWNQAMRKAIPDPVKKKVGEMFEPSGTNLELGEMQIEEGAGLGFGVTLLLLASSLAGLKRFAPVLVHRSWWSRALLVAPFVSLFVFMYQSGLSGGGRLLAPYYALLVPALLISRAQERVIRSQWWKAGAAIVFFLAFLLVVIQPARPLWPAQFVLEKLRSRGIASSLVTRAESVYAVYRERPRAFAPALAQMPADASPLGIISYDDPETSLWKPFGSRRIEHVRSRDSTESIVRRNLRYVFISSEKLKSMSGKTVDEWVRAHHAEVLKTIPLRLKVTNAADPQHSSLHDWVLVRMPDATARVKP